MINSMAGNEHVKSSEKIRKCLSISEAKESGTHVANVPGK